MGIEPVVAKQPEGRAEAPGAVVCDQAIFSSMRTPTGQGYQLIGASRGLSPAEKRDIQQRSPSHGGLCQDGADASAVAFYRLTSRRLGLAVSRDAGAEHTGRGARRIHTHITVIQGDDFARFAFDPFRLIRAVQASGALEPQLQPPAVLPPLELVAQARADYERALSARDQLGARWLAFASTRAMAGERWVFAGDFAPDAFIEAVLLGIPGPLRGDISFSAGLRFSTSRHYSLTAVGGDPIQTRRLVRGQRLQYAEPVTRDVPPLPDANPWPVMIERHWQHGTVRELADLTSRSIPDCSEEALNRIGSICLATDAAPSASVGELAGLAERWVEPDGANAFEAELARRLALTVQSQLRERFRQTDEVAVIWPVVAPLLGRSRRTADLLLPVAGIAMERLAQALPLEAARIAIDALAAACSYSVPTRLAGPLRAVLEGLRRWSEDASVDDLKRAKCLLTEWCAKVPQPREPRSLLGQIDERLTSP